MLNITTCSGETQNNLILSLFLLETSCFLSLTRVRKKLCILQWFENTLYEAKFTNNQATCSMSAGREPKLCLSATFDFEISTALSSEHIQWILVSQSYASRTLFLKKPTATSWKPAKYSFQRASFDFLFSY